MRPVSPARPGVFAYADPPYPGCAHYYDEQQEVDHTELVARLVAEYPDGWALSTSSAALRDVLPLCPPGTRVCVWRRRVRGGPSKRALSAWEPLLVYRGRELATNAPQQLLDDIATDDVDLDEVLDYRGRYDSFSGALVGMKPPEFAVFMFAQLGARPGDTLEDLYPGSGAIGRAWTLYTSLEAPVDAPDLSHLEPSDLSHGCGRDPSRRPGRRRAGRVPHRHGGPPGQVVSTVARPKSPGPYDGHPFAPIGALTAAEHAWGRGLVQRGYPTAGWHVVGRDAAGDLVAVTVLPCGTSKPGMERHCYQSLTPRGLIYRTVTVPIDDPKEQTR